MNDHLPAACVLGLLLVLGTGCLILGSVRDVECEVLEATSSLTGMSANATPTIPQRSVTVQFACTNSGWISLANVTAEVRIAEKDREVGGGWYTAGDLVAVQQVPLGTLEPNTPVIRRIRFRKLNWSRDVGIRIRPYQE
ncbi:MAG: hypothetical protein LUP93_06230 [Methanomicrobiales archaeon]|nr:hypothetical protein [Methanomicrobiales archaeon]MDD1647016.1 hypothetical protein [Methanomicrobiales archaeon]